MASRVNWRGDQIKAKVDRAARLGIDATMQAAIMHAKRNHGQGAHSSQRFETDTGELERGIRIISNAKATLGGIVGRWGARGIKYARRIELGFQGKDAAGRIVDAPAYPFLRPAADAEYGNLAGRIRRAYRSA